jgi:hypothetical protein
MCNAYADVTGNWHVQPMFIEPTACSTDHDDTAIVDEEGNAVWACCSASTTLPRGRAAPAP